MDFAIALELRGRVIGELKCHGKVAKNCQDIKKITPTMREIKGLKIMSIMEEKLRSPAKENPFKEETMNRPRPRPLPNI